MCFDSNVCLNNNNNSSLSNFSLPPIQVFCLFVTLIFLQLCGWFCYPLVKENDSEKLFQTWCIKILSKGWYFVLCINVVCFGNGSHVMQSLTYNVKMCKMCSSLLINSDAPIFLWNIAWKKKRWKNPWE